MAMMSFIVEVRCSCKSLVLERTHLPPQHAMLLPVGLGTLLIGGIAGGAVSRSMFTSFISEEEIDAGEFWLSISGEK